MPETLIIVVWVGMAALFGLLIGSFLNVCIYRLPAGITIVRGRSFCPNCKHSLSAMDLFPVFSYLLLGRRCRYCREPISPRYACVELLTSVYFALAAFVCRPGRQALPGWLLAIIPQTEILTAAILLTAAMAFAFCGFLIWTLIIWDGHDVPSGLFLFIGIPVLIRLGLQPERLFSHLAAMLLSCLTGYLLLRLRLLPDSTRSRQLQLGAGLGLMGLMSGLQAVQPLLAVMVVEIMLMALLADRGRPSSAGRDIAKRAEQLWRSLPLQILLVGAVLWLVF